MRRSIGVAVMVLAIACNRDKPSEHKSPRELLDGAIAAHGGRERLSALENLSVVSRGRFKGSVEFTRRIQFRGPDAWRMSIEVGGVPVMAFGLQGERCWRKNRHLVSACRTQDQEEHSREGKVLEARLLHRLDRATLSPAPARELDGQRAPAFTAGALELVLDPKAMTLSQIRYEGDRIETFSELREIGGARIGARRVLTIDGELDVDETWEEIRPGAAKPEDVAPPPLSAEGVVIDEQDIARPVAWTEVDGLAGAEQALQALERFSKAHDRKPGGADGIVISPLEADRFRVAVTLEGGARLEPTQDGALHLETWPAKHVVGIYRLGDAQAALAGEPALKAEIERRKRTLVPGARPEVVCVRDCFRGSPSSRLMLLRMEVGAAR